MRKAIGRAAVLATMALAGIGATATPAMAEANPYTPQQACHNDHGGTWSIASDGSRALVADHGVRLGTVYLLYNSANGHNCVASMKSSYVGTKTYVWAGINVQNSGEDWTGSGGPFAYYQTYDAYARGTCVMYAGVVNGPHDNPAAGGGRHYWGNCG